MKAVRSCIRAGLLLASACLLPALPAQARDLTVTGWGGSAQAAQDKVFYKPFMAKTGINVLQDSWSGGIGIIRTKVQGGAANWDIVQVEADELSIGCLEGLYEKLDWPALGGRDSFMPEAASDCGVGAVVWSTNLAYDGDKLAVGPTSWADFWDTTKFPGKRAMRRGPKYTLEFALMADGVPPKDVYKVLRAAEGVDRAFKKLDALKPNIIWWTSGGQPGQLFVAGEITMAVAYASRMLVPARDDHKNFKVVWPGSIYAVDSWTILKGSPNRANAMKLLAFMTSGENQRQIPTLALNSVPNLQAIRDTDPKVAPLLTTYPANIKDAVALDAEFWVDNIDQLTQRFNAWASK